MQKVQTFQAPSMHEALRLVKRELGDRAVILGTRTRPRSGIGGLVGRAAVEITAAVPAEQAVRAPGAAPPACRPSPALPDQAYAYYERLVRDEVAEGLAQRLARQAAAYARQRGLTGAAAMQSVLSETIAGTIPVTGGIQLATGRARRVALVGPAGSGKTTTLAKLAAHFALRCRKRVVVLSLDMQRPGTNEQLGRYAKIIGVAMGAAQTISAVKDFFRTLGPADLVLIDTHGVCAADRGHFARLAALLRAARPDEVHLVLPASTVPSVQARAAQRFGPLGVSKVVLTRLDEAVGLGVILNAVEKLSWGLSYVTDGESVPNHIEEACAERIAGLFFAREQKYPS